MPKCRICKTATSQRYGLTYACSIEHALEFAAQQRAKKVEKDRRQARQKNRADKQKLLTLEQLCAKTQKDVNKYVMALARYEGRSCISCNSPEISDSGHFIHAGSKYRTSRLRFSLLLLEPQCQACNRFSGGGNARAYEEGLRLRYGQERLDQIKEYQRMADSNELEPLTKEEVIELGKQYRAKTREIESCHKKKGVH